MIRIFESVNPKNVFNTTTTGTSYYDDFLNPKDLKYMQEEKNLDGKIVYMTPKEYFEECANNIFDGRVTVSQLLQSRKSDYLADEYAERMEIGIVFDLCYLNYANNNQEGLHRMLAFSKLFGWDSEKAPILVVTVFDEDEEKVREIRKEAGELIHGGAYSRSGILSDCFTFTCNKMRKQYYGKEIPKNADKLFNDILTNMIVEELEFSDYGNVDFKVSTYIDNTYDNVSKYSFFSFLDEYKGVELNNFQIVSDYTKCLFEYIFGNVGDKLDIDEDDLLVDTDIDDLLSDMDIDEDDLL